MTCRCARTLSSGSCLSERRDRAYGGKPGFPLGSLPAANCTTGWTEMLGEEPSPGGLVKFHTVHKLTREAGTGPLRAMAHNPS
jgi:hypothetical protein